MRLGAGAAVPSPPGTSGCRRHVVVGGGAGAPHCPPKGKTRFPGPTRQFSRNSGSSDPAPGLQSTNRTLRGVRLTDPRHARAGSGQQLRAAARDPLAVAHLGVALGDARGRRRAPGALGVHAAPASVPWVVNRELTEDWIGSENTCDRGGSVARHGARDPGVHAEPALPLLGHLIPHPRHLHRRHHAPEDAGIGDGGVDLPSCDTARAGDLRRDLLDRRHRETPRRGRNRGPLQCEPRMNDATVPVGGHSGYGTTRTRIVSSPELSR